MFIIYCATSPNGKRYIGITGKYLEERIKEHAKTARTLDRTHFQKAINKYGAQNFIWEILMFARDAEEAFTVEKLYIHVLRTQDPSLGYNHTEGGEGRIGWTTPEDVKEKQRNAALHPIVDQFGNHYRSSADAAKKLGLHVKSVQRVAARQRSHTRGYVFRRYTDLEL